MLLGTMASNTIATVKGRLDSRKMRERRGGSMIKLQMPKLRRIAGGWRLN